MDKERLPKAELTASSIVPASLPRARDASGRERPERTPAKEPAAGTRDEAELILFPRKA
jgi:hypothetical protein